MTGKSGSFGIGRDISFLYFVKFIAHNIFSLSYLREICVCGLLWGVKVVLGLHIVRANTLYVSILTAGKRF